MEWQEKNIINYGNIRRAIHLGPFLYSCSIKMISGVGAGPTSELVWIQPWWGITFNPYMACFWLRTVSLAFGPIFMPHRNSCWLLESYQPQEVLERTAVYLFLLSIDQCLPSPMTLGTMWFTKIASWYNTIVFINKEWYKSVTFYFSSFSA